MLMGTLRGYQKCFYKHFENHLFKVKIKVCIKDYPISWVGWPWWLRRYSGETEQVNGMLLVLVKAKALSTCFSSV